MEHKVTKKQLTLKDQDTKNANRAIGMALAALGMIETTLVYKPESTGEAIDLIWEAKQALYDLKWRLKNDKERK